MEIRLLPVSDERYLEWLELSVGTPAPQKAAGMLPDVRWIQGQMLRVVRDSGRGKDVGFVWYGRMDGTDAAARTVHHLVIREDERGKGYGTAALRAVEDDLRRADVAYLDLEVSPENPAALHLCRSAGFARAAVRLQKRL